MNDIFPKELPMDTGINDTDRTAVVAHLSKVLADTYTL